MNSTTQKKRLRSVIARAGQRYSPDLNVELPIVHTFDALSRSPVFYARVRDNLKDLHKKRKLYIGKDLSKPEARQFADLQTALATIFGLIEADAFLKKSRIAVHKLKRAIQTSESHAQKCIDLLRSRKAAKELAIKDVPNPTKEQTDDVNKYESLSRDLYDLRSTLWSLSNFINSMEMRAANSNLLILQGPAGIGKTHLLCDIAASRIKAGLPVYIFLGDEFLSKDPWEGIRGLLRYKGSKTKLLKDINAYSKRRGTRALILVDALNESSSKINWDALSEIKKYPNISLAVSIRDGFEDFVIPPRKRKKYLPLTHYGFQFEQWAAVKKFFREYGITFTEFPPLLAEFQNPLFLKIFCIVHNKEGGAIKGQGATKIFEEYADYQGKEFLKLMGEQWSGGPNPVWEYLIKEMALWIAKSGTERIPEAEAKNIIEKRMPMRSAEALVALEKTWLVSKIPRYGTDYKVEGFDYRFPYQRFSDHLIVRSLLKENIKRYRHRPKRLFHSGPLDYLLSDTYRYRGMIEALAIQIPEWFKGRDLIDLVPESLRGDQNFQEAFFQSLVWREIKYKNNKLISIRIRDVLRNVRAFDDGGRDSRALFFDTLLTVASIPNHPLNARYLDKLLRRQSLPIRDAFWIPYLFDRFNEGSPIDRIIEWSWDTEQKVGISETALELLCIAVTWLLGTSHRVIRDRATKSLVSLLNNNLQLCIPLLKRFDDVNDPYIKERLYAAIYGACLVSRDKSPLEDIGQYVYRNFFQKLYIEPNILLRDYARGIVEASLLAFPTKSIAPKKIRPPYKSKWPSRISSERFLDRKYSEGPQTEEKVLGLSTIKYSVSGGDFGRYTIESRLGHWRSRPLKGKKPLTPTERNEKFIERLSTSQRKIWDEYDKLRHSRSIQVVLRYFDSEDTEDQRTQEDLAQERRERECERRLKSSLTARQKKEYRHFVKPFMLNRFRRDLSFDDRLARRYVLQRVLKCGWSSKLHGSYDRHVWSHDRGANKSERIGKKYQWIALHELMGLVADHFEYGDSYRPEKVLHYDNPSQVYTRDIDPSNLLKSKAQRDPYRSPSKECWWLPKFSSWNAGTPLEDWVKRTSDIPALKDFCIAKDFAGKRWVILDGSTRYIQPFPEYEETYERTRRELWMGFNCFFVRLADVNAIVEKISETESRFPSGLPLQNRQYDHFFLREYPDGHGYLEIERTYARNGFWENELSDVKLPASVMPTNIDYYSEEDDSSTESFHLPLPIKPLFKDLHLEFLSDGEYGKGNRVISFDPSVRSDGPATLAFEYDEMKRYLKRKKYALLWFFIGEKLAIGGPDRAGSRPYLRFSAVTSLKPSGSFQTRLKIVPDKDT